MHLASVLSAIRRIGYLNFSQLRGNTLKFFAVRHCYSEGKTVHRKHCVNFHYFPIPHPQSYCRTVQETLVTQKYDLSTFDELVPLSKISNEKAVQ